jgi:uncharacterized protein YwgA
MENKDWTLFVISCARRGIISPIQLQKSLFLFKQKKPSSSGSNFYKFIPYNYGPFCREIYTDVDRLISEGLVKYARSEGERWLGYTVTDEGKKHLYSFEKQITNEDRKYLSDIVDWVQALSFRQLLRVIYKEYPEYKINSIFPEL